MEQPQPEQPQPPTQTSQPPAQIPPETPTQQPTAPATPKKFSWKRIILVLIALLLIGGTAYAIWAYQNDYFPFQKPTTPSVGDQTQEQEEEPKEPSESAKAPELKSLDETWNIYINYQLGFSIKVPKEVMLVADRPDWVIPVKIFEDTESSTVFISTEYRAEDTGETEEGYEYYYPKYDKVLNSLELIKDEYQEEGYCQSPCWKIVVEDVVGDAGLTTLIEERLGSGFGLGEKKPSTQEGVYDVEITLPPGMVVSLGVSIFKYSPTKNKVIYSNFWQADTFCNPLGSPAVCYDEEMSESPRFIE